MQGHIDEAEFIRNRHSEDEIILLDQDEFQGSLLKQVKSRLFSVFFRMNTLKFATASHYHLLMLLVETFQLLSLALVDGSYSTTGPYQSESPWNLSQTQWLIDVCWVFRIDRYFRTSYIGYIVLVSLSASLLVLTVVLIVALSFLQQSSSFTNFLVKGVKVLATLHCDLLYIPVMDSLAFGMKCAVSPSGECLDLGQGYGYLVAFIAAACVFAAVVLVCSVLYYDMCFVCGGVMAKPHPRIKLLRLLGYSIVIFAYYFTTSSAKVVLFLLISLAVGALLSYIHTQYMPYFHSSICKMRQGSLIAFTSAIFCMLIGEFFKTTDQTNSSVTMLFYFLTPCLVQITQLALAKRGKALRNRKIQHIANIYQVEMKGRMHLLELEEARSKSAKSLYSEEERPDDNFKLVHDRSLQEIETLYAEAFKKFPNSEFLYLWSGLLQLHLFESYILAMVQCYKGMVMANKLDSQYAFYHFSRTAEGCYKHHMKDDAYDYVLFEKCLAAAQKNDESVTRSQFFFWSELESKSPKLPKLTTLSGETSNMIGVAKSNYQLLIKLNSKSTQALLMYGGFLKSLNNFSDVGDRYIQKAEMQAEAQGKNVNATVLNALTQPLSFFDAENSILSISGDFETLGEIQKANPQSISLFGYYQAELVGRNVSLLIPSPFAEAHDDYMRKFHESGQYSIVDNSSLTLYFLNKRNYLFEARTLVKVVPSAEKPPYLMAVIIPTKQTYELLMLTSEYHITAASEEADKLFDLNAAKNTELKAEAVIANFSAIRAKVDLEELIEVRMGKAGGEADVKCTLGKLLIGAKTAFVMRIETGKRRAEEADEFEKSQVNDALKDTSDPGRAVSTLKNPISAKDVRIAFSEVVAQEEEVSSSESEEESGSEDSSESSSGSESQSESQSHSTSSQKAPAASQSASSMSAGAKRSSKDQSKPLIGSSEEISESVSKSASSSREDGEREEANDARSALSSSKSMGSSMASLAYFNKHIKALISFEFARTKKYEWRFKLTLISTIVLLIITSILTFKVIQSAASYNENLSHFVNLVGNLRLYSLSLAYYIRVVSLMDLGFLPSDSRAQYYQWMTLDSADMHAINLRLYRNYDLISDSDRDVYIRESIPTWLMEGQNVRRIQTNLFDATSNVVLQSFLITQELSNPPLNISNRRAFYVYRNGEGELLSYLNKSAKFYVNSALRDVDKQRLTAILLIMASVLVLLFCAGFAIIPAIRTLEKSKREVWDIFFEIPAYVCRIMKGRCNERLGALNESASIELEELKEEGREDDKERIEESKAETTKSLDKPSKKNSKPSPETPCFRGINKF